MTSVMERLRELLDERGVEHYDRLDVTEWVGSDCEICHTSLICSNGATVLVLRKCTTPEQAIAATLGSCNCSNNCTNSERTETCHEVMINRHWRGCSECGYVWENMYAAGFQIGPNYCPMCGAKRVDE